MENNPFDQKPIEAGQTVAPEIEREIMAPEQVAAPEAQNEPSGIEFTMDSKDESSIAATGEFGGNEGSVAELGMQYVLTGPDGVAHEFATRKEMFDFVQELREADSR
jgi:hypothetical protein